MTDRKYVPPLKNKVGNIVSTQKQMLHAQTGTVYCIPINLLWWGWAYTV
jgi:hypothetical protein